jgi:hypothetical protein
MKKTATTVIIGSMVAALVACGASEEFKKSCKDAGGEVKRESEVSSIFSMEAIGFDAAGTPPKPVVKAPAVVVPKIVTPKAPVTSRNVDIPMPTLAGKGKGTGKSRSSSDDDYVCVKGDKVLFEED